MPDCKLILFNHYASIPCWPGPTRNFDFAATLVGLGWKVNLFSCKFNHYLRSFLPNPPKEVNGVRLQWIWSTPYRGNSLARELNILIFSFLSFWRGLFTPGDCVLTVTPPLESAFFGWLLAKVKRIPFVLDVEDLWPDSIIAMGFNNKMVISGLRFLEHFLYRRADHLLVVAGEMKEYLLRNGVDPARITMIPLGANIPPDHNNRTQIRAKYGWTNNQIIAVYVGAHGPANSLETIIEAARQLTDFPRIKLALFGDGSAKPGLQMMLNKSNLTNITLEQAVTPEMVPDILRAADIGIASLKNTDTFKTVRPNKLYEYMAVGLPIVCCIDGEARRLVTEVESGVPVTPEDAGGLARALQELTLDHELRLRLGENGRSFVTAEGDRRQLAVRLGEVLQQVILDAGLKDA